MADTKTKRASQVRKKQILLLSGISLGVIVIALGASALMQPGKKKEVPLQQQAKTRTLQVGSADAEREAWRIQSGSELQNIAKQITDLNNKVTGLQEENKKLKEGNQAGSIAPPIAPGSNAVMPPAVPPSMQTNGKTSPFGTVGSEGGIPPPLRADGTTAQPNATGRMAGTAKGTLDGSRIRSVAINEPDEATKVAAADKPGVKTDLVNSSKEFGSKSKRGADGKERFADDDPLDINRAGGRTAETYLPTGTTMRVVLLNGLDAPTGGQSQSNPMPVNLMVDAAAQLPNGVKANLKGCFITGSGHGDLSSERAFVRLDRLSCVDEDGGAIDVAVKTANPVCVESWFQRPALFWQTRSLSEPSVALVKVFASPQHKPTPLVLSAKPSRSKTRGHMAWVRALAKPWTVLPSTTSSWQTRCSRLSKSMVVASLMWCSREA